MICRTAKTRSGCFAAGQLRHFGMPPEGADTVCIFPVLHPQPSGQKRVSNRPRKLFVGRKRQVPSDLKTETLLAASLIDQDAPLPSNSSIRRNYHLRILPRRSKQQ